MDYGNKFNLFDNEDEIIKLLDDAAARMGCQATNENIPTALYYHPLALIPSILDLIIADNEVCLFLVQIDGDPLLPRYLTDKYCDDLQYMQVSYLHLLRKMKPLEQLMMKERLMANHVPMWDSKKVMKFVMRYSARKSA